MAFYYVSSLAPGGGTGTELSPFTLQESITFINAGAWVDGDTMWVKADGLYTNSTFDCNITNASVVNNRSKFIGYSTVIGDNGRAQFKKTGGAGTYCLYASVNYWYIANFELDGNSLYNGFSGGQFSIGINLIATNCVTYAIATSNTNGVLINCRGTNTPNGIYGYRITNCYTANCSALGFTYVTQLMNCAGYNNAKHVNQGTSTLELLVLNCSFDVSSSNGIEAKTGTYILNTSISNAGGTAILFVDGTGRGQKADYINFYNNAIDTNDSGSVTNTFALDPQFTAPATGDFTRSGTNLDKKGLTSVGLYSFNYEMAIGVAPRKYVGLTTPTFAGISALTAYDNGTLRVQWLVATNYDRYNIYIKPDNSTGLFTSTYHVGSIQSGELQCLLKTEADQITLLSAAKTYYVGVKAENANGEDANVVVLNAIPNVNMETKIDTINTKIGTPIVSVSTDIAGVKTDTTTIIADTTTLKTTTQFVSDVENGRWKVVANQMIFYKPDNLTELFRVNLFDQSGNPTMTDVFERQRV